MRVNWLKSTQRWPLVRSLMSSRSTHPSTFGGGRPRPEPNGVFLKLSVVDEDRPDEAGRYIEVDEGASRDFTTRNLKVLVGMELGYSTAEMKARALHHDGAALHDDAPLSELDLRSGDTLTVVGT